MNFDNLKSFVPRTLKAFLKDKLSARTEGVFTSILAAYSPTECSNTFLFYERDGTELTLTPAPRQEGVRTLGLEHSRNAINLARRQGGDCRRFDVAKPVARAGFYKRETSYWFYKNAVVFRGWRDISHYGELPSA